VLAIPGISLSTFIGEAMRAANRTLFGTIISAYAVNLFILVTILLAPHASLMVYAWAFFGGSLVAAALAVVLGRTALPGNWEETKRPVCRQALKEADEREVIGIGRAALLWGPLCILAISTTALQMAEYAVAYRTAMIVDFFLPALNLSGRTDLLRSATSAEAPRQPLEAQLRGALLVSSAFVAALLIATPVTLRLFGYPYNTQWAVYALLLGMQWANSVGRPAVRHAVVHWDAPQIRAAVGAGALAALIVCAGAIGAYGALAAAGATLIGALVLNLWAIVSALRLTVRVGGSV
jgi:O-antigen/teichoic acid export membrane protein